jgi:hypothetical protein
MTRAGLAGCTVTPNADDPPLSDPVFKSEEYFDAARGETFNWTYLIDFARGRRYLARKF